MRADHRPPAHLPQQFGALLAVRRGQLAGGAGVVGQQGEERAEGPLAAAQPEEEVAQLDADAGRPVVALVAQGEENIWLAAVSAPPQATTAVNRGSVSPLRSGGGLPDQEGPQLCLRQDVVSLLHGHGPPVVVAVEELQVRVLHQFVLFHAGERAEVGGQAAAVGPVDVLRQQRERR